MSVGVVFVSTVTCTRCGSAHQEAMPKNACQIYYECGNCGAVLRPNPPDCCIFVRLAP